MNKNEKEFKDAQENPHRIQLVLIKCLEYLDDEEPVFSRYNKRIKEILGDYKNGKMIPITVALLPDGTKYVLEGKKRIFALLTNGCTWIDCKFITCMDRLEADELQAEIFLKEKRAGKQPLEIFWSELRAEKPRAITVYALCTTERNISIGKPKGTDMNLNCVGGMYIFLRDSNSVLVGHLLDLAINGLGGTALSLQYNSLKPFYRFLKNYSEHSNFDIDKAISIFSEYELGDILDDFEFAKTKKGGRKDLRVYAPQYLRDEYNKHVDDDKQLTW